MSHQPPARITRRSAPTSRLIAAVLSLVCLTCFGSIWGGDLPANAATPDDKSAAGSRSGGMAYGSADAAAPSTGPNDIVAATIDALIENESGVYGVVLMRPDGRVLYSRNGETPFVSASLYKLILLANVCKMIDAGALTPDMPLFLAPEFFSAHDNWDSYFDASYAGGYTTVQEAMFAAGAYSSNVAAMALLTVTSIEALNKTAVDLGLSGTFLFTDPTATPVWPPRADGDTTAEDANIARRVVMGYASDGQVNMTTPIDMARYFALLMNGRLVNERVSEMIVGILREQAVDDRFPALLPPDTEMVHKTGNLEHVIHDVGVIYAPDGPVILVAMVEAPASDERAVQVVQRLALIAYGIYDIPPIPDLALPIFASPETSDATSGVLPGGTPDRESAGDPSASPTSGAG